MLKRWTSNAEIGMIWIVLKIITNSTFLKVLWNKMLTWAIFKADISGVWIWGHEQSTYTVRYFILNFRWTNQRLIVFFSIKTIFSFHLQLCAEMQTYDATSLEYTQVCYENLHFVVSLEWILTNTHTQNSFKHFSTNFMHR